MLGEYKLKSLMKPGGLLVISERCTYYVTDLSSTKKYTQYCMRQDEDDAHKTLIG